MPQVVSPLRNASFFRAKSRFGKLRWQRLLANALSLLLILQAAAVPVDVSAVTNAAPDNKSAKNKRQEQKTNSAQLAAVTGVVLTPLATPFNGHTGIDYHQAQNKLIVAANAPAGQPKNFELIAADGSHAAYSNVAGVAGELKIATARDDGQNRSLGGFVPGDLFFTTGAPGVIAQVSANGNVMRNPWVTLPNESGAVTGLALDRTAVYGGDVLAVTATGRIWRVNYYAQMTLVAELNTPLAGLTAIPNNVDKYGPWAGRILTGAPSQGALYAVNAQGQSTAHQFGINPSELRLIPAHENFFGIDAASQKIWGVPDDAFAGMIGEVLIAQATPGKLGKVRWNGATFEYAQIAQAASFKQITFAPAGAAPVADAGRYYEQIALVRHGMLFNSGRVEGAIWQLNAENTTLNGSAVITSDLLVPGTPNVVLNGSPQLTGTLDGAGNPQPSNYQILLNGAPSLRYVVRRVDPIAMPAVPAVPTPPGTRDVFLNNSNTNAGNWATVRHLDINGSIGPVAVPPGTYGNFTINGANVIVLGTAGASAPSTYNLQALTVNGASEVRVVGPVILNVNNAVTINGGSCGTAASPGSLLLNQYQGNLVINGSSVLYALVRAPNNRVTLNGNSRLRGTVACDRLEINGTSVLQLTDTIVPAPPVNRAPNVNAGADQTITFPTSSINLQGTASDDGLPPGIALSYAWSKLSGPGTVTFSNATSLTTTATFAQAGVYVLRLTASDSLLTNDDEVQVTVVQQNQSPTAFAGPDQTISLPVDTVTLQGTASDDGLPSGAPLSYTWSKLSGPGNVVFGNTNSSTTTASFSAGGIYVLRLTVSDSELSATDDATIFVNRAPQVNAGADQTISQPNATVSLQGLVVDDGLPPGATLTYQWSKVSGPGNVTFSAPAAAATNATFSAAGAYTLRLTASDSLVNASDDVAITVNAQNQPPVVNAGTDQTITLPVGSVTLQGTASDDGLPTGSALSYTWTRASGPGTVAFSNPNGLNTTATFSVGGVYTLRLTVSDTVLSASDEVNITVNQAPAVNAGADRLITLPTNSLMLIGTVSDDGLPQGGGISVSWSKLSGPGTVTFGNANALSTTATFSSGGVYVLRLTASDSLASAASDVTITVNQAPTVSAGPDKVIALPVDTASLQGMANDDGLPQGLSYLWNKVSGPGSVIFSQPTALATNATFGQPGTYVLSLTTSDSAASNSATVTITVLPRNQAPVVSAGSDLTVALPNAALLNGSVTDDGLPQGPLTVTWNKVSGPGTASFGQPNQPITSASFSMAGVYVLRLTVSDSEFTVSDDVVVTANNANQAPLVNAGADQTIASPNNSTSLFGIATDDGFPAGVPLVITWTRVSGPSAVTFGNPTAPVTTVTFNDQGSYVLRLTVSDSQFTVSDDVQVVVGCASNLSQLDILLVIDRSGSMQGQALLDAKAAAKNFVDRLKLLNNGQPGNDQVGLVSFGDSATLDQPLTHDAAAIKSKIDAIQILPGFGTDIGTGINQARLELTGARRNPNAVPIMILLSDGDETIFGANSAANFAKSAGIRLMTIGTGLPNEVNFNSLRAWASSPNDFYYAPTSADLGLIYGYIAGSVCRNQPPLANAGPDFNVFQPATATINGSAADDGLPVGKGLDTSWAQVSGPAQASILNPNASVTSVVFPQPGSYVLRLTVTDSVFTATDEATITVVPEALLQGGTLTLTTASATTNQIGTAVTATATLKNAANQPIPNFGMRLNITGANANVATGTADANGFFSFTYTGNNSGADTLAATAVGTGQTLDSNELLLNWTASPTTPIPSVTQGWIGAPLHQTTISGIVPVTLGQGVTLTQGTVELCKDATTSTGCVMLNNNATGGAGAAIATVDATQLANGPYIIRLTGTNASNQQLISQVLVTAVGENKPGRMTLKIPDFTIPVTGIPITIARRYDSLERNISGDFGYGWALDVYATRLEVAPDHDVTLTDPGTGRRVTFEFAPLSYGGIVSYLYSENFTPEPGFYGKLTSDGCGLFYQSGQQFRCLFAAAYQPATYVYTDPYGRRFEMGADGKLRSIRDLNGNTLTITASGITTNAGNLAVPFVRDAQGRITQITDTTNKVYQYSYLPTGELKEVTLPGVVTRPSYTYDAGHRLLTAKDARGNAEATMTYHSDGRLATMTDAVGNTTSYAYNLTGGVLPLAGQLQVLTATRAAGSSLTTANAAMQSGTSYATSTTVTHQDGGTNASYFDSYGMLLAETNALGQTATNTYDANHNLLAETNELGQTTSYSYDSQGNVTTLTDAGGNIIRGAYNEFSLPVTDTDALGNTRTIIYDENGLPTEIRDSLGTLAKFVFDTHGSLLSFTDGAGGTTTYSYDQYGNLIAEADPLGNTTKYTYDQMGRRTSVTNPRGLTTTYSYDALGRQLDEYHYFFADFLKRYEYDANGNRTAFIDELGRRTTYTYDAANRLIKTTFPDSTFAEFTYNHRDQRLTGKDQGGNTTSYEYDLEGQVSKITRPDGKFATAAYDAAGRVSAVTDERGYTTRFNYDPSCECRDRLTTITDALNQITQYRYDASGRRVAFVDALSREVKYSYDVRGRLTQITFPDQTTGSFGYDGANRRTNETDEAGKVTRYNYNLAGDLIAVIDALSQTTGYGYDANRNLETITNANNRTTTFSYSSRDQLQNRTLPDNSVDQYRYDAAGNLKTRVDFRGKTTTYNYDGLNRLTIIVPDASLGEPAISYSYTPNGDRATMVDGTGTTTYSYDGQHGLMSKQTPFGTLSYDYDAAFNLKQIKSSNVNGILVDYSYDALNRLETVNDRRLSPGLTTYSYDAVGNLKSTTQPNGVLTDYTYNNVNLATNVRISKGAQVLANYAYTFKPTGHRATVTEQSGRTVGYEYDDTWRLTSETISGAGAGQNGAISYVLDKVGNRLQRNSTVSSIPSTTNTYNNVDRMSGDVYDANGNTIQADGKTYAYDFEDRLKSVNNGQIVIQYDGDGNRVTKTIAGVTTQYLMLERTPTGYFQVAEERVNGQAQRSYVYGHTLVSQQQQIGGNGVTSFYGLDSGNHIQFLTDETGIITDSFNYDAYGNLVGRTGATSNNYLFRGEQFDSDLGFHYLRARYYDQQRGRFRTMDPFPGYRFDPLSLHKYFYAGADPVNLIDPSGLATSSEYPVAAKRVEDKPSRALAAKAVVIICKIKKVADVIGVGGTGAYIVGLTLCGAKGRKRRPKDCKQWTRGSNSNNNYWKEYVNFKGNKTYMRDDLIDFFFSTGGMSNLERMLGGKTPIGPDGEGLRLHHVLQTQDGPLVEVTKTFHEQHTKILHINPSTIPSGIDRDKFDSWREHYWKCRAWNFIDTIGGLL